MKYAALALLSFFIFAYSITVANSSDHAYTASAIYCSLKINDDPSTFGSLNIIAFDDGEFEVTAHVNITSSDMVLSDIFIPSTGNLTVTDTVVLFVGYDSGRQDEMTVRIDLETNMSSVNFPFQDNRIVENDLNLCQFYDEERF